MQDNQTSSNQNMEQNYEVASGTLPDTMPDATQSTSIASPDGQLPAKADHKKSNLWIILGSVFGGLVLIALAGILVAQFMKAGSDSLFLGEWSCTRYMYSQNGLRSEPTTTIQLKSDGTFVYGQYGDLEDNHFAGTYTASPIAKTDALPDYNYFKLSFGPTTEYILNGEAQDTSGRQMDNMEIGIIDHGDYKEASLVSENSYMTYHCEAK